MDRNRIAIVFACLAALTLVPEARSGPSSLVIGVQDRRLEIRNVDDFDPVANEQTSVRSTLTWMASEKLTVVVANGWADSFLGLDGTSISGMTDGRLRLLYRPTPDWVIGGGTVMPFGLYELTANEVQAAQWMWNPRSGFPLSGFGEGLGWEFTLARAFSLSERVSAGLAFAFLRHAEFELLGGETGKYRLGSETGFSAAIDWELGRGRMIRLDGGFVLFGSDELSGEEFIDQGNVKRLGAAIDYPFASYTLSFAVKGLAKSDNTFFETDSTGAPVEIAQPSGNYLYLDLRIGRAFSRKVLGYLGTRASFMDDSEYAIGANGTTVGFGPGIGYRASNAFSFTVQYNRIEGHGDGDVQLDGNDWLFTMEMRRP